MDYKSEKMKKSLFLITFGVVLFIALSNIGYLLDLLSRILSILFPFLLGGALAFIFNGPMMGFENLLFGQKGPLKKLNDKIKRPLSYLLTLISFLVIIFVLLFLVIPELTIALGELAGKVPVYLESISKFMERIFRNNPFIISKLEEVNWVELGQNLLIYLENNLTGWLGSSFNVASSAISSLVNFGLAFVFSVYALLYKEHLIDISKKLSLAYLPEGAQEKTFKIARLSNQAFSGFLNGKLREVFVIIGLFAVTMKLLNFPYALTISVLIGTLTLIPWFGVFIGFAIGFLLILAVDVKMAFWFLIVFTIIYQLEGNLIYPIVVGQASGLSSIWIFVAGTLGAKFGGIAGLMLSIPIFSVIYSLVEDSTKQRLEKK